MLRGGVPLLTCAFSTAPLLELCCECYRIDVEDLQKELRRALRFQDCRRHTALRIAFHKHSKSHDPRSLEEECKLGKER